MDVYRTQTYMPLWRAAKAAAGTAVSKTYPNMIPDACKPSLGLLITYLLVAGAILRRGGKGQSKRLRTIAQDATIVHFPTDRCADPAYGGCMGKRV